MSRAVLIGAVAGGLAIAGLLHLVEERGYDRGVREATANAEAQQHYNLRGLGRIKAPDPTSESTLRTTTPDGVRVSVLCRPVHPAVRRESDNRDSTKRSSVRATPSSPKGVHLRAEPSVPLRLVHDCGVIVQAPGEVILTLAACGVDVAFDHGR